VRGGALSYLAAFTLAAVAALITFPSHRPVIAVSWTLAVLAGALWIVTSTSRRLTGGQSSFDAALQRRHPPVERPDDLARCERAFGWKVYSPKDFDFHVRPHLRDMIVGASGGRERADASERLDPLLSSLLSDAPADELFEKNVTTADIAALLDRIEAL
jgi:hypothetical protein